MSTPVAGDYDGGRERDPAGRQVDPKIGRDMYGVRKVSGLMRMVASWCRAAR